MLATLQHLVIKFGVVCILYTSYWYLCTPIAIFISVIMSLVSSLHLLHSPLSHTFGCNSFSPVWSRHVMHNDWAKSCHGDMWCIKGGQGDKVTVCLYLESWQVISMDSVMALLMLLTAFVAGMYTLSYVYSIYTHTSVYIFWSCMHAETDLHILKRESLKKKTLERSDVSLVSFI